MSLLYIPMIDDSIYPYEDDKITIIASVSNPIQKKTTLSSYTAYLVKGEDREGDFSSQKRYSDFDHARSVLSQRWPGCFIPPIPKKKVIGNSQMIFVEERCHGLDVFVKEVAKLKHLWYSKEFQILIRGTGDIEKQLKTLQTQNPQDILKKYEEKLVKINGKNQDTTVLGRVLEFANYTKKILPVIQNFKEMALSFVQAKNANSQQFSILLNFVLPQYEKSCLAAYCNQNTQGKFIFNEKNDEKLAGLIDKFKNLIARTQFEQLYRNMQQEERQIEAFIEAYKVKSEYDDKLKNLKTKQKDLQLELVKLNAGKTGFFGGLTGNVESKKAKANNQLQGTRDQIKMFNIFCEYIVVILGFFEIPRFREEKMKLYFETIKKIALFQIEFTTLKADICDHILENHNLM